jgi:hypothetical protein
MALPRKGHCKQGIGPEGAFSKELLMLTAECLHELRTAWLPNMTDVGLGRLIELLERGSPMLIHGCFAKSVPMGCLATHLAWNHPRTAHLTTDAGITWLHRVAGLNPATSHLIHEWDRRGPLDLTLRHDLLEVFHNEQKARSVVESKPRANLVPAGV